MKILVRFSWDANYGMVEGLLVTTHDTLEKLYDKEIYFGEILGKHSEVYGKLIEDDFEVISEDQHFIEAFEQNVGDSFGYNPLEYIEESVLNEEEDELADSEWNDGEDE